MHMHISDGAHSNDRLRQERVHHNWRQQDLADLLGTTVLTIKRWEGGKQQPSAYFRARLCTLFGKSAEELGLLPEIQPIPPVMPEQEDIWSVPFPRNPFFTGRDLVLDQLHAVLTYEPTRADLTRSYVLSGLGGIGKTQLALEYAYQHRSEYHTVFWIEAETLASLTSSFVRLAELLALPEATEENHSKIVSAVLHWLNRQERWLLIFDNVEDLSVLKPFLPVNDRGALLLTTRLQALGTLAQRVSLSPMTRQEGGDFLLARTNYLGYGQEDTPIESQERMLAEAIATEMGGLPLALEQAGAYIDATQCGFSDYLHLFRQMQYQLLETHELSSDHPLSVSRTFSLAFEQVAQRQPLAADMLTVCAFLAPDAIPESFLLDGAPWLGPTLQALENDPLAFAEAIKVLLSYSLLQRNASTRTISVHRLVQVVIQGRLTDAELRSRGRGVLEAMMQLFPAEEELQANDWLLGDQLLTHAQACLLLCEQWHDHEELCIPLMSHVASYLSKCVRYAEAEVLFRQAIHMGEHML
ncbi:MAG TPA: NB-ARC domain-containing protein, partial [Ktedonobacteraceae bacterium]|nr:NB-ARC domain-containing protein [Ktedonobacteraceae bacterium]